MVSTRRNKDTRSESSILDTFVSDVIEKPQIFFAKDEQSAAKAIAVAKNLYDTAKKIETIQLSPFDELLTEGFDNDQIWEELAMQNDPFLSYAREQLEQFEDMEEEEDSQSGHSLDEIDEDQLKVMEESDEFDDEAGLDDDEGLEVELLQEESDEQEMDQDDLLENEDVEEEEDDALDLEEFDERPTRKGKPSEVDDEFFDLNEFNEWTEKQEQQDMLSEDERELDEEIDFDDDLENDLEDDEEQNANDIRFSDFFKPPPKPFYSRESNGRKDAAPPKKKKSAFDDMDLDGGRTRDAGSDLEDDVAENEEDQPKIKDLFAEDDKEEADEAGKSGHERRLERVKQQIEEYEMQNVGQKDWTLGGEASAKARPLNSLLEEDLEFDHAAKPVPVITQESTETLEDMIKKRIVDNNFDDVVRKADPADRPFLPSKLVELDDSKSKKSLAELYEDDYVKQTTGATTNEKDEKLANEHREIDDMFLNLCSKLDALSNFHYTPKAPKPEITVVSNAAAISMEEVIPVNVSDATLLAPEEVFEKKRTDVKGDTELDQGERAKMRAAKKKAKRKEKAMKEREMKVVEKMNPGMGNKHAKSKAVKELVGQKNVSFIDKDGKKTSGQALAKIKV